MDTKNGVTAEPRDDVRAAENGLFIVGVGASAGGLDALERMFEEMPVDTGAAFVLVQHLSPDFRSMMDELLARRTQIPIRRVEDGMRVEPNHIYLIPPKKEMIIAQGQLRLTERDPSQSLTLPIDHFFRSLAADCGERSVAVVLSGTGTDGSRGVREVHNANGLVIVQSEETAKFNGMPRSAIDAGVADLVLSPEEVADAIGNYITNPDRSVLAEEQRATREATESALEKIVRLLQDRYSIDFNHYKTGTIFRRSERRVLITQSDSLEDYANLLEKDPEELHDLYSDLLIGVTQFYRDPKAFQALTKGLRDHLGRHPHRSGDVFRVWIAGCATGEEAYTIAMILDHEMSRTPNKDRQFRIFATDVDQRSLEIASRGIYSAEHVEHVPPAMLKNYFRQCGPAWEVVPELRQRVVFARHDLLRDAPFTKINLISCRNLLIYFKPEAQTRALSLFHFGLVPDGLLLLGISETPGQMSGEFASVDDACRLFRKSRATRVSVGRTAILQSPVGPRVTATELAAPKGEIDSILLNSYDRLLDRYMPDGILLTEAGEILHVFGNAGSYLAVSSGRPTASIFDATDGELKVMFQTAIPHVTKNRDAIVHRTVPGEAETSIRVRVERVAINDGAANILVLFEPAGEKSPPREQPTETDEEIDLQQLTMMQRELDYTRESLQATIEELETSNEELQATNEELTASNEELQSTNEELHSVNEELFTVNAEYQEKIEELTRLNNDMDNLLASTEVHTIFLDERLRIRRFTGRMAEIFNLLPRDEGRPIEGFAYTIGVTDLFALLHRVLDTGNPIEQEVLDFDDAGQPSQHYLMRIMPYVVQARCEGVVLTLVDITSLKRAHAAIEESEQRFRTVADNSPALIWRSDADGRFSYVNSRWSEVTGRTELSIEDWSADLHPEDRSRWDRGFENARSCQDRFEIDLRLRTREGHFRWFLFTGLPRFTPDRKFVGHVGSGMDITETRIALSKLQESESRYERAVLGTADGIWEWKVDAERFFFSPRMIELLAYKPGDLPQLHRAFLALLHPDDRGVEQLSRDEHLKGNAPYDLELRILRGDGSYRWYRCRGICHRDENGDPVWLSGSIGDIQARKEAEGDLSRSQKQLQSLLDHSPAAIFLKDLDGRYQLINKSGAAMFGGTPRDWIGRTDSDQFDAATAETIVATDQQVIRERRDVFVEESLPGEPTDRILLTVRYPLFDETGEVIGVAGISTDVSRQRELEATTRDQVEQRDRFLAILSHELRNPFAAIREAVSILESLEEAEAQEDVKEMSRIIGRQSRQVGRLLDDLLDVARIASNQLDMRREPCDLTEIVNDVLDCVGHLFRDGEQQLAVDRPEQPMLVVGDPTRLMQVQVNLLTNAAKHSGPQSNIYYGFEATPQSIEIVVRDDGKGIHPKRLPQIFELFTQTEQRLDRPAGGLGLGLSIVKGIVEAHHGHISVTSDGVGCGVEFRVALPREVSIGVKKSSLAECRLDGLKVLLVEDSDDIRRLLARSLRRRGVDVNEAACAKEAIDSLENEPPRVVILDVGLPDIDGFEVARRIREKHTPEDVVIVAATGYGREDDRRKSAAAGIDAHLVKPIEFDELLAVLAEAHDREAFTSPQPIRN